jgi:hypothetical protein
MITILFLTGNSEAEVCIGHEIQSIGGIHLISAATEKEAYTRIGEEKPDAIVALHTSTSSEGVGLLEGLRSQGDWSPFILFS